MANFWLNRKHDAYSDGINMGKYENGDDCIVYVYFNEKEDYLAWRKEWIEFYQKFYEKQ